MLRVKINNFYFPFQVLLDKGLKKKTKAVFVCNIKDIIDLSRVRDDYCFCYIHLCIIF